MGSFSKDASLDETVWTVVTLIFTMSKADSKKWRWPTHFGTNDDAGVGRKTFSYRHRQTVLRTSARNLSGGTGKLYPGFGTVACRISSLREDEPL